MAGTGTGTDGHAANLRATVETLERMCSTTFRDEDFVWATHDELGRDALDPMALPQCSAREYADPKCPLRALRGGDLIRWVETLSLTTGKRRLLPLRAVFIAPAAVPKERYLHPISTGCAAHVTVAQALLSAVLEVVERDSLSLTWLQKFALPKIDLKADRVYHDEIFDVARGGSRDITYAMFDATTDLGIPVVYGLRKSRWDRRLHTLVSCAAAGDARTACRKVLQELAHFAVWLRPRRKGKEAVMDFDRLYQGPVYMARKRRADAFEFLMSHGKRKSVVSVDSESPIKPEQTPEQALKSLLRRLKERGHEVFATDLSTREARAVGIHVVRVVIPTLMPFSWVHRARYLGHPRLFQAPTLMGYPTLEESEIHAAPQPFG